MPVPNQLKVEIEVALKMIENHPEHEYGPGKRKSLFYIWKSLKGSVADKAYKWLAIITAEKVLPFYSMELQSQAQELFNAQIPTLDEEEVSKHHEMQREIATMPHKTVELAKQVLRGEADADEASNYCNSQHYVIGNLADFFLLPRASFVNQAANKALGVATRRYWYGKSVYDPFAQIEETSTKTDFDWVYYANGDTTAYAAMAWAYDTDTHKPQSKQLLKFWQWWLTDAIEAAWNQAEGK